MQNPGSLKQYSYQPMDKQFNMIRELDSWLLMKITYPKFVAKISLDVKSPRILDASVIDKCSTDDLDEALEEMELYLETFSIINEISTKLAMFN
jgi:hypothetical protein